MTDHVFKVEAGHFNLSPVLFRTNSRDYFKAYLDFEKPGRFSPVPILQFSRAIEKTKKTQHIEAKPQKKVKDHNNPKGFYPPRSANFLLPQTIYI